MKNWLKFLAGTPKRTSLSLLLTFAVVAPFLPHLARILPEQFSGFFWPLVSLSIVFGIVAGTYCLITGIKRDSGS